MKVILTKDVPGVGRAGDVKEVSDGYARNFLLLRHFALPATTSALDKLQKENLEQQAKLKKLQEKFEQLRQKLESKVITVKAKADKAHLFAAVKPAQIAAAINEKMNLDVLPEQIFIDSPIKTLGEHTISLGFASNPPVKVRLLIEALN